MYMQVGEHITVTGRVDEDWLEGSLQGRKGIFPASFIDCVPPGLSKVGEKTKESSPVQQSGVNSKPAKVGVAQYKGVWHSERGVAQQKGCGTAQGGVAHYVPEGVAQYRGNRMVEVVGTAFGVSVTSTKECTCVSYLSCTPAATLLCYCY